MLKAKRVTVEHNFERIFHSHNLEREIDFKECKGVFVQ